MGSLTNKGPALQSSLRCLVVGRRRTAGPNAMLAPSVRVPHIDCRHPVDMIRSETQSQGTGARSEMGKAAAGIGSQGMQRALDLRDRERWGVDMATVPRLVAPQPDVRFHRVLGEQRVGRG